MLEKEISKYNLDIDIKSNPFKNNIIEVNTILKIKPTKDVKYKMLAEINYTALVSIDDNFEDKKKLEKIILVNIPRDIYPMLFETFVYLFAQAGIKNMNITKEVDFEKMYNSRK